MASRQAARPESRVESGSNPWTDLGLTLPVFVGYHLGVVFFPIRNAADMVTRELVALADHSLMAYGALTLALGGLFVSVLMMLGRGHALRWERFVLVAFEGIAYAIVMRVVAGYVVGRLLLMPAPASAAESLVMALGAGFYEELAFRVGLFGLGAKLLPLTAPLITPLGRWLRQLGWAVLAAAAFSAWHYAGELGDPFDLRSFLFRWVAGIVFTAIYALRGFAPVVWTHALYDIWVLVL